MKKMVYLLCLLFSIPAIAQEGKYADDVQSVDAIMVALYDVISGPAGQERDWDRMRHLFAPDARLQAVGKNQEGQVGRLSMTIEDYIKRVDKPFMENGFFEAEIHRKAEHYGYVTHVFSTYVSRRTPDGEIFARGINSIQIAEYEGRFWIVNILWNGESPDNPIPSAYLPALLNQETLNHEDERILVGQLSREGLKQEPYNNWFEEGYQSYEPEGAVLQSLAPRLNEVDILAFMGTWCSDSQRDIPHLFKVLDQAEYNLDKLQLIGLSDHPDHYKQSPQHEEKGWEIEYVPTIILLRDGREIGRIVEYPMESLEKDMLKMLSK